MYVFREFNQTHSEDLRFSITLYLSALFIAWTLLSLTLGTMTAFSLTMLVLLTAHAVRIVQLSRLRSRSRTVLQNVFLWLMGVAVVLLVVLAYSPAVAGGPESSWRCFRAVFLSLTLAGWLSAYLDFAVSDLFAVTERA